MCKQRGLLLAALLCSVTLHVFFLASGEIGLPDVFPSANDVLASKAPSSIQHIRLAAPKSAPRAHSAAAHQARRAPAPAAAVTAAASTIPAVTATPAAVPPLPPEPTAVPAPVDEPAPAFPVQIHAVLDARYNGFPFSIQQTWLMEGLRYSIDLRAVRFGFHFRVASEGSVNPQGGLNPEHYRLLLNEKVRSFADYKDGELRYGSPDTPRNGPLTAAPQDMASLPFHVAVTFRGPPETLIVTTGNGVYEVRLIADAEEILKLPAGTLRTLHLKGERYDVEHGRMQTGYEVWLALDYLNYPVKFVGLTGNGDRFEYRVKQLDIEGRPVLDDAMTGAVVANDDAIPEWIRQQTIRQGLNNH